MKNLLRSGVWAIITGFSLLMACNDHPGDQGPGPNSGYALSRSDAAGVQTTIKKHPATPSSSNKATFSFICNAGACTYKCSLDNAAWKTCTSPKSYKKLSEGAHNFQVKASSAGKSDRTPALYSWMVDARLDVQGILDNTTIIVGQATLLDRIETRLASLFLKSAQATVVSATTVDTIIAASPNGIYYAVLDGSTFNLAVPRGAIYILGFYNGMALKGILTLDTTTDLNSIPALENSSDFSLGTVSLNSSTGVVTATISQADAFTALGLDSDLAVSIGIYDDELSVKTSVDVDGNGKMDDEEGKRITLRIDNEFIGAEDFNALNNESDIALLSFKGYAYQFDISPDRLGLDWENAFLTSPQDINGENNKLQDFWQIWPDKRSLSFYSGGGTSPMPPPQGTYIVRADPQDFTFDNVSSIAIDSTLNEVYAPSIKLTFSSGKVTQLDWQFWKKSSGIWSLATDSEIQAILDNGDCSLGDQGWNKNHRVYKNLPSPLTASGSITFPAQNFAPAHLYFFYSTFAGYGYGFNW